MKAGFIHTLGNIRTHISKKQQQVIGVAIGLLVVIGSASALVYAGTYDAQINQLKNQNAQSKNQQQDLQVSAGSISDKIASLQAEIAGLESQIQESQAKDQKLQADITAAEAELAHQKEVLGQNIKQMYVENEMSTLEMLASSKNLGDYIDRAQYRNSVQSKITATVDKINTLKQQLDAQRVEVQRLLADQQAMQARVAAQKAENDRLLAMNQEQQSQLEQEMKSRNSQITDLQRKQAEENARYNVGKVVYGGSGGYPWANVPYPSSSPDPWGMYKRECVSYTAWKVASTGRYMPYWGGRGNAKQWDDNARAEGIPVDTSPRVGDVAVSNSGTYGHVMYVESVNGDGTITVSQYNANWDGNYSVARRATTGLVFIHF
jgi:peptidoglycan DL-endopeptidase CwlO